MSTPKMYAFTPELLAQALKNAFIEGMTWGAGGEQLDSYDIDNAWEEAKVRKDLLDHSKGVYDEAL